MKNNNKKSRLIKSLCLILALIIIAVPLCSCSNRVKKPILKCNGESVGLGMYEFYLSRMKGTLARNKYNVSSDSTFWKEKHPGSDMTNEEYYNKSILDNCKTYLAALVIFEEEGLTLSHETLTEIDNDIRFFIEYDAKGSEDQFDNILAQYGTNAKELRQIYEMEAKYRAVINALYGSRGSLISDSVKEEYYQENYYRFKQILVSDFYYKDMTDTEGNVIYFDPETGKPMYDEEKGKYKYDENNMRIVDKFGVPIRFDEEGKIVYDTKNGKPSPETDEKGNAIKYKFTEEEMQERIAKMNEFIASCEGNPAAFEAEMPNWRLFAGVADYYPDGYYFSDLESSKYSENMLDMLAELKKMEVGDISVVESDSGYHVIMKYELDRGKYADSEYAEWFVEFTDSLITKLFLARCQEYFNDMKTVERNLKKARSIKDLGTNYNY